MMTFGAMADQCYTYATAEGDDIFGAARRVSPNGRWVVGGDDIDETGGYIIDMNNPAEAMHDPHGLMLDVNDAGTVVGTWFRQEGYAKYHEAAYYKDGVWTVLPKPEVLLSSGQCDAVSISADGKTIVGHGMCENENPDEPGKYVPIVWTLNESTGEYEVSKVYNNLWLPGTYGFYVQDMSPDGKWICGFQGLDFGDNIGVILNTETDELKTFHNISYEDRELQTIHPQTGKPITMVSNVMVVDGYIDGLVQSVAFSGRFMSCNNKYIFGSIDEVSDVKEDGSAKITTYAAVYDIDNDRVIKGAKDDIYLCGDNDKLQFNSNGEYVYAGVAYSIAKDFDTDGINVAGIYSMDNTASVLSGSYLYYSPLGDILECPVVLKLDKGLSSIQEVGRDADFTANVEVADGRITVTGAADVAIFALNGAVLTRAHSVEAAPGVYIVIADGHSAKVIVK